MSTARLDESCHDDARANVVACVVCSCGGWLMMIATSMMTASILAKIGEYVASGAKIQYHPHSYIKEHPGHWCACKDRS